MNGTFAPVWVVVVATSGGGFCGSYGLNPPVVDMYSYEYVVGALHCGSLEPFWHTHGCTCGPANSGPPIGWLTSCVVAAGWPGRFARSVLEPSGRPVRSASYRPFGRTANAPVTSRRPNLTRIPDARAPRGARTATSASPPEIRFERPESTSILGMPARRP